MNDKRNLICGNVMLLSQFHDETSLFVFAKKNSGTEDLLVLTAVDRHVVRSKEKRIRSDDCWFTRPYAVVSM